MRIKPTPAHAADMHARLSSGKGLSTKDFELVGYSFEAFLMYGQLEPHKAAAFHAKVLASLEPYLPVPVAA